jgi:hypothetical protein
MRRLSFGRCRPCLEFDQEIRREEVAHVGKCRRRFDIAKQAFAYRGDLVVVDRRALDDPGVEFDDMLRPGALGAQDRVTFSSAASNWAAKPFAMEPSGRMPIWPASTMRRTPEGIIAA